MTGVTLNPALEGVPLFAHGHSFLASDMFGLAPGQRYINRAGARLGMPVDNRAVGGAFSNEVACRVLYHGLSSSGASGLLVIDATINDAGNNGAGDLALHGFREALRSIGWFTALDARWEDGSSALTRIGGTITSGVTYSGGHFWTVNKGETGSCEVYTDFSFGKPAGTKRRMVVGFAGLDPAGAVGAGHFEVLVDGVQQAVLDLAVPHTPNGSVPMTWISEPLAGAHKVLIRPLGGRPADGTGPWFDYAGLVADQPLPLVLVKCLPVRTSLDPATIAAYNAVIDAVAAERPGTYVCDPNPGFDAATMIGSDGVHLTARGHAHVADALVETLAAVGFAS